MNQEVYDLRLKTAQYAVEHITGIGPHRNIACLRDSFNELCEVMGADESKHDNKRFDLDEVVENLRKEPWVKEIAAKPSFQRSHEDNNRIIKDFICKYWMMYPEDVTFNDVADILKIADPLSKRHIVASRVTIDCIHALNHEELHRLDDVLYDLEKKQ